MTLSSNDTVDRMAQNRAQAIARDTSRARAADARRFTLETQAADRTERQRMDDARAARTAASDRAADRPATTQKPAATTPERRTVTTTSRPEPARRADPPAKAKTAARPSDDSAPAAASPQAKAAAKAATDASAPEAAQTGEAEAALAGALGTKADETDETETASAESSDPEPGFLFFAQPAPATRASPTAASAAQGDAAIAAAGAKGKSADAGAIGAIASGEADDSGADSGTDATGSGFAKALTETGALPSPSETGLQRHGAQGAASASHTAAATAQAAQPSAPPVPIGQVPLTIGLRSLNGSSQFEIRLDPLELGRIEVKLDIDKDRGTVSTHIVVERPETLALLQRDASQLQQALTQAGLDASESGINLSLRGDGANGSGAEAGQRDGQSRAPQRSFTDAGDPRSTLDAVPLRSLRGLGSLDIRI